MTGHSPTRRTVLMAGAANLFVGVIKLVAGVLVGSSAMLAEAAHSAADTLNQGFLLASLRRGDRPADSRHPFGYGQKRYFWSLLAVLTILASSWARWMPVRPRWPASRPHAVDCLGLPIRTFVRAPAR
jgi:cation diffusion facilitator family transporter